MAEHHTSKPHQNGSRVELSFKMAFFLLQAITGLGALSYLPSLDLKPAPSSGKSSNERDASTNKHGNRLFSAVNTFGMGISVAYSIYQLSTLMRRDHSYHSVGFLKSRKSERIDDWKWPVHQLQGDYFLNNDGLLIFVRSWTNLASSSSPKGCVLVIHGLMEHSGLYDQTARVLNQQNYIVMACDLQGHGRSEGDRFFVRRFKDYVEDVVAFIQIAKARYPDMDIFLFGHSMSGLTAALAAEKTQKNIKGLILSAPALAANPKDVPISGPFKLLAPMYSFISEVFPHLRMVTFGINDFVQGEKAQNIMENDPLRVGRVPSRTIGELIEAMPSGFDAAKTLAVPLLVIHGTGDLLTPLSSSQDFINLYSHPDKTFFKVEGGRHDVLLDDNAAESLSSIVRWLDAHSRPSLAPWTSAVTDTVANVIKQGLTQLK